MQWQKSIEKKNATKENEVAISMQLLLDLLDLKKI